MSSLHIKRIKIFVYNLKYPYNISNFFFHYPLKCHIYGLEFKSRLPPLLLFLYQRKKKGWGSEDIRVN